VIKVAASGHTGTMAEVGATLGAPPADAIAPPAGAATADARLRALVDVHYDFIWRSLRRLGVADGDVDDAAQHVFLTAARKLDAIRAGCERSYLFQTAMRVASDHRRTRRRRREVPEVDGEEQAADDAPSGEELLDLRRARRRLDCVLDGLPLDLRAVFVLFELDEMTMAEIAVLLELPPGTVASRLRRARAEFRRKARDLAGGSNRGRGAP
jgi:RNA polymerase sigma-70 factor (ECF subfamily)